MWTGLTFTHADAAPPRLVGRVQRLDDHALVPRRQRVARAAPARPAAPATPTAPAPTAPPPAPSPADRAGPRRRGAAGRRTSASARPTPDLRANREPVTWNGIRPPVLAQRDRLAVEHERRARQRQRRLDDLRQPRGHVVERAREDPRPRRRRDGPGCARRRASTRPRPARSSPAPPPRPGAVEASIGAIGRPTSSRNCPSASAARQRRLGHRPELAAQHQRPPHGRRPAPPPPCATASPTTAASAPWRRSPSISARRNACSDAVARASSAVSAARRAAASPARSARPAPRTPHRPRRRSDDGDAAGGGAPPSDAQPDAEHPLARRAREYPGARRRAPRRPARAARRRAARPWPCARTRHGRPRWRRRARRTARRHSVSRPMAAVLVDRRVLGHRPRHGARRSPTAAADVSPACARTGAGPGTTPIELDVTAADVERLRALDLDALVNNAGIAMTGPLEFLPLDELRRQLEVNTIGQLAVIQACLPALRAQPRPDRQRELDLRPRRAPALRAVRGVEVRLRGAQRLAAARAGPRSRSSWSSPARSRPRSGSARSPPPTRSRTRCRRSPTSATDSSSATLRSDGRAAGRGGRCRRRRSSRDRRTRSRRRRPAHPLRDRPRGAHLGRPRQSASRTRGLRQAHRDDC